MHLNNSSTTIKQPKSKPGKTINDRKNESVNVNLNTMKIKINKNKGLFKNGL